eukprot:4352309-Karenia_brevis.AAC.1
MVQQMQTENEQATQKIPKQHVEDLSNTFHTWHYWLSASKYENHDVKYAKVVYVKHVWEQLVLNPATAVATNVLEFVRQHIL